MAKYKGNIGRLSTHRRALYALFRHNLRLLRTARDMKAVELSRALNPTNEINP